MTDWISAMNCLTFFSQLKCSKWCLSSFKKCVCAPCSFSEENAGVKSHPYIIQKSLTLRTAGSFLSSERLGFVRIATILESTVVRSGYSLLISFTTFRASSMCFVGFDCEENMCLTIPFLSITYVTLPGRRPRVDGTP